MVDDLPECVTQFHHFPRIQLALENGELEVVPVAEHELEYTPQPLGIRDVVGNDVHVAHGSPDPKLGVVFDLADKKARKEPSLYLEDPSIADAVVENGVTHQLIHPPLERENQALPGRPS
jgi:hypothetical protein